MQVIKKINNNAVICRDGFGRDLVAFGKGIGFPQTPYELADMSQIQRTFYNISPQYLAMFDTLPWDVVEFTSEVVDMAMGVLSYELTPNLVLTLADHISFALERKKKGIYVKMPLAYDLELTYPQEMKLAKRILRLIYDRFHVKLARDEASGIAMAFINARVYHGNEPENRERVEDQIILQEITKIVEDTMHTVIDRTTFNYARYATHVQYLLERLHNGKGIDTINEGLYGTLRDESPETAGCVDEICSHLNKKYGFILTEEEQLYLFLHVNRVCSNENT